MVTHRVLTIAEEVAGIATLVRSAASFLEFVVRRVSEAKNEIAEVFGEFIGLGEEFEAAALVGGWGIQRHGAFAHEHSACDFSLDWRDKAYCAPLQVEGGSVALEIDGFHGDGLAAERDIPELLVRRIGVGARRSCDGGRLRWGVRLRRKGGSQKQRRGGKLGQPRRKWHEASREERQLSGSTFDCEATGGKVKTETDACAGAKVPLHSFNSTKSQAMELC